MDDQSLLEDSGMSRRFVPQPLRLARALALARSGAALAIGGPRPRIIRSRCLRRRQADRRFGHGHRVQLPNPHGLLALTAKDANGKDQQWKIETNSPNILRRRGWSETSIKPGDLVTVEGYPARDGSNFMRVLPGDVPGRAGARRPAARSHGPQR